MHCQAARFDERTQRPAGRLSVRLDPASDLTSVQQVLARVPSAAEGLVDRLACLPAMIRTRHRRMGSPLRAHELDDVVQSVPLALWQKLTHYRGDVPLLFWACGFGAVELRKAIERRGRRLEVPLADEHEPASGGEHGPIDRERLLQAVDAIDQPDRDIVRSKHFDGLTFEDIAARTNLGTNTVKTKYYRALGRLRERLLATKRLDECR